MCSVYFISNSIGNIKVGKADHVLRRVSELQTASAETLVLLGTIRCIDSDNAHSTEKLLHRILEPHKVRGEWFEITDAYANSIIKAFSKVALAFDKPVKAYKMPNFTKVGNGTMNKHGIQSLDFLQEVIEMTKAEQLVISTIKNLYTWDNRTGEVQVKLSKVFDKSKTKTFLKGFGILNKKGLVRRTKTGHYMINPNAVYLLSYEEGMKLWEESETT